MRTPALFWSFDPPDAVAYFFVWRSLEINDARYRRQPRFYDMLLLNCFAQNDAPALDHRDGRGCEFNVEHPGEPIVIWAACGT